MRAKNEHITVRHSSLYLASGDDSLPRLRLAHDAPEALVVASMRYFDDDMTAVPGMVTELPTFIERARRIDPGFGCSPQVLNLILDSRDTARRREIAGSEGVEALRSALPSLELSRGEAGAVLEAFVAGRAVFTGEAPAGIPHEAIALAEFFRRRNMAASVLIVCPTSLKIQWQRAIAALTDSSSVMVEGGQVRRRQLYKAGAYYHIVSYHSLASDVHALGAEAAFDIVICDHAERISGWSQQIASGLRRIKCDYFYAFACGNDPEKLLCPACRRVLSLDTDNPRLHHDDIMLPLPMTRVQARLHDEYHAAASAIAAKWNKSGFLTEKERKRLLSLVARMRMACDSSCLVSQEQRSDTKPGEAVELVRAAAGRAVIFTQWPRMASLMKADLERAGLSDKAVVATDSLSEDENLRGATMVINLDVPLRSDVLQQRLSRVICSGQPYPLCINMVSAGTVEERMTQNPDIRTGLTGDLLDGASAQLTVEDAGLEQLAAMLAATDETYAGDTPQPDSALGDTDLVADSIRLLGRLATALAEPDGAARLAAAITYTDPATGRTEVRLPVDSAETVSSFFTNISKLLSRSDG